MFNQAGLGLTPPFPLIRRHSALNLVCLICLVYLVRLDNPTNQKSGPVRSAIPFSHPLYAPISAPLRFTFHVLRFTLPERQGDFSRRNRYSLPRTRAPQPHPSHTGCGKTVLANQASTVHNMWHTRRTIQQDAQKGRPARPQRVKTGGVPSRVR